VQAGSVVVLINVVAARDHLFDQFVPDAVLQ